MTKKRGTPTTPNKNKQADITRFAAKKPDQQPSPKQRQLQETPAHYKGTTIDKEGMESDNEDDRSTQSSSSTIIMANAQQDMEIDFEGMNQGTASFDMASVIDFPPLGSPRRMLEDTQAGLTNEPSSQIFIYLTRNYYTVIYL
jgi:hypothetical protein